MRATALTDIGAESRVHLREQRTCKLIYPRGQIGLTVKKVGTSRPRGRTSPPVPRGSKRIKCTTRHTNVHTGASRADGLSVRLSFFLSLCGQTLNNDGLLSVWFNDEDCQAHVRDAYFLNW